MNSWKKRGILSLVVCFLLLSMIGAGMPGALTVLAEDPPPPEPPRPPQDWHVFQEWEDKGTVHYNSDTEPYPTVVQRSPSLYAMWYDTPGGIYLAQSSDGLNWDDVSGNITYHDVIIPAGYTPKHPWVVYQPIGVGGRFLMYASVYHEDMCNRIYVFESIDGLNWHYLNTIFHEPDVQYDRLDLMVRWDTYWERFDGWLNKDGHLYYATSNDGVTWTEEAAVTGLPLVTRGSVLKFYGRYLMWYGYDWGGQDMPQSGAIGVAFSHNGIDWQQSPDNPIFRVEPENWWQSKGTYTPVVIYHQDWREFSMWFTGKSDWDTYYICKAWAPTGTLGDVVAKASWGDRIYVHPGVYTGQVYTDKAVEIRSTCGDGQTIINAIHEHRYYYRTSEGDYVYPAMWMNIPEGGWETIAGWWEKEYGRPQARVEGFTICGADGPGILFTGTDRNATIRKNSIHANDSGIVMTSSNVDGSHIEKNYISNNNKMSGIVVGGNNWVGIKWNDIHGNGEAGIWCGPWNPDEHSHAHIEGNQISNNGKFGIYSSMRHGEIRDNTVSGNGDDGIHLETGDGWPQIRNNSISSNNGTGIWMRRGHADGNDIIGNGGNGIQVEDWAWITNNTISNNQDHGIDANQAEIRDNDIDGSGKGGIKLRHGYSSVLYNTSANNTRSGIACYGEGHNTISGNTLSANNAQGIRLYASFNFISANNISGNTHGILVDGDSNQMLVNTITNNTGADSGIHLTEEAEDNVIHYNNIIGNTTDNVSYGVSNANTSVIVDAENNWWGNSSGPGGAGSGTGDNVSDYVDYSPWLGAFFLDNVSPIIEDAVALPQMIAVFGMFDGEEAGEPETSFIVAASDNYSGVVRADVNLKELLLQLTVGIGDFDDTQDWLNWIQQFEFRAMWYNGDLGAWRSDFHLWHDMFDDVEDFYRRYGLGEQFFSLLVRLNCGELTVPVTVWDGAGNSANTTIPLTVVDVEIPVAKGWNLRSTPMSLQIETMDGITSLGDGLSCDTILAYDATLGWRYVLASNHLKPLHAWYIHATANDQLGLIINRSPTTPPTRDLAIGWNLIGPASPIDQPQAMLVAEELRSIEENVDGQRGYLIVTSPGQYLKYREPYCYNKCEIGGHWWQFVQETWVYLAGDPDDGKYMSFCGGHWVFMEHADTLAGFMSTPIRSAPLTPTRGEVERDEPGLPALYYGTVTIPTPDGEVPAPKDTTIVAKVDGQVRGSIFVTEAGKYGGATATEPKLLVQGDIANGSLVRFYINGVEAYQTSTFTGGQVAELDLRPIDATPPPNPTSAAETNGVINSMWQDTVSAPAFAWTPPADSSGINGYFVYWGANKNGISGTYFIEAGYSPVPVTDPGIYYLRVRTKDNAENVAPDWVTLFTFKYGIPPLPGETKIADIWAAPLMYEGLTVTVSGEYRGWESGHGSAPVTRNDWVIQDDTGSIYVTGSEPKLTYPDDVGKLIKITGVVRLKDGQPYIEVTAIGHSGGFFRSG